MAMAKPERKEMIRIDRRSIFSSRVMVPSSKASANMPNCMTSISRRRSTRSAMAPPIKVNSSVGAAVTKPLTPSNQAESVISNTSQPSATVCIQVPILERKFPLQNTAKSRCLNERKTRAKPRALSTGSPAVTDCAGRLLSCSWVAVSTSLLHAGNVLN